MNVYAIIVTYNGMRWYDRCLGSLKDSEQQVSTIVIDNASTDETVEYIKSNYPEIHLIKSNENLGFAKANNIGIRYAIDHGADYVFLLNQDAWVEKNTLSELIKTFSDNENVGIVSPIHLNGTYSAFDFGFSRFMIGSFFFDALSDAYLTKLNNYYDVSFVNAAAWLINAECIKKVGGFDTLLFLHYGEDDNYCQRTLYHGYRILINTKCTICHDREQRKANEEEYRKKMIDRNPGLTEKRIYGNINIAYNINRIILQKYIQLVLACLWFSPKKIKSYKTSIIALKDVKISRRKNKKMGLTWL